MHRQTLVGCSDAHRQLLERLDKVAGTDAEVLISGQSGTGKELYARYIHDHSRRAARAFVPVNCGSLADDLLENELFGHVGGAFTGAKPSADGLVQAAEGGSLFLDEIDSLSIPCQVKLLRFLQDRQYRRLGETRIREADIRLIAATNDDLVAAIEAGRFRADLYFRIRVVPVHIPRLNTRPDDIVLLIDTLTTTAAESYQLPRIEIGEAAMRRMRRYPWPGNVRELQNCIKYLTCLQLGRPVRPEDLPLLARPPALAAPSAGNQSDVHHNTQAVTQATTQTIAQSALQAADRANGNAAPAVPDSVAAFDSEPDPDRSLSEVKRELICTFERQYVENALCQSQGNISQAARVSGKARRAFFELIRKYDIDPDDFRVATE